MYELQASLVRPMQGCQKRVLEGVWEFAQTVHMYFADFVVGVSLEASCRGTPSVWGAESVMSAVGHLGRHNKIMVSISSSKSDSSRG